MPIADKFNFSRNASSIADTRKSRRLHFSALQIHPLTHAHMDRKQTPRSRALHDYEFQRSYKACIPCSRRKVKCELGDDGKCSRCTKKGIDCIFTPKKPWSRAPKGGQKDGKSKDPLHSKSGNSRRSDPYDFNLVLLLIRSK